MSYVNIPPAYYAAGRPGTAYHPGGSGWLQANVDGWGENPNNSWPGKQGASGLGAGAPPCTPGPCPTPPSPPFSYVGTRPWQSYIRLGISPWGAMPHGRAYGAPRPLACKNCVGMPIRPGVGALGGCGACQIESGGACLPCPEGSDIEGCQGCVGGVAKSSWLDSPLLGPVVIGVLTAVGTGLVVAALKKSRVPVSG